MGAHSGLATIIIHGADVNITSTQVPTLVDVEALSGHAEVSLEVYDMMPEIKFEDEEIEYSDNYKQGVRSDRLYFYPRVKWKKFPSSSTGIGTFFAWQAVARKKYKWLEFNDYTLIPSEVTSGKCLAVGFGGIKDLQHKAGMKSATLILYARKRGALT